MRRSSFLEGMEMNQLGGFCFLASMKKSFSNFVFVSNALSVNSAVEGVCEVCGGRFACFIECLAR